MVTLSEVRDNFQSDHVQSLGTLGDRLENVESMSVEQSTTLSNILELLKQQFPTNPQSKTTEPACSVPVEMLDNEALDQHDGLQTALRRLSDLAEEKEKILFSTDAEEIIHDIEQMFFTPTDIDKITKTLADKKGKRRRHSSESDCDDDNPKYQRDLKQLKGLLTASHCVVVNDKGISRMRPRTSNSTRSNGFLVSRRSTMGSSSWKSQTSHYCRQSGNGAVTIHIRRRHRTSVIKSRESVQVSSFRSFSSLF